VLNVAGVINCAWLTGQIAAAAASPPKGFDMHHPTKKGWRLTHICIEGPEAAVYYRGKLKGGNYIELPEYWKGLVDSESITVQLTPIGVYQELYYEKNLMQYLIFVHCLMLCNQPPLIQALL